MVIGAGAVARRKVRGLLAASARVTVIAAEIEEELQQMGNEGQIRILCRPYHPGDLIGYSIAIAATDSISVNHEVYQDAQDLGILVNVVDDPEFCDFFVPAIVARGDLLVAVSTSGKAPLFAKRIRQLLEKKLYPGIGTDLALLGKERKHALEASHDEGEKRHDDVRRALEPRIAEIMRRIEQS